MPRLLVEAVRLRGETLHLRGADARYLGRVLRLGPGDRVTLFDGAGVEVDAEVVETAPASVALRLGPARAAPARAGPALWLLQALPKADKLEWIVQKATELGVARVTPVVTRRSVPRPDRGPGVRRDRLARIAGEAARQCGRADVPAIDPTRPLAEAVAAPPPDALRLVPWEGARQDESMRAALRGAGPAACVALLIGPEGGLSAGEVALAQAHGFVPVSMGPRVLRTETAAIAACALVLWELGDLGGPAGPVGPVAGGGLSR